MKIKKTTYACGLKRELFGDTDSLFSYFMRAYKNITDWNEEEIYVLYKMHTVRMQPLIQAGLGRNYFHCTKE